MEEEKKEAMSPEEPKKEKKSKRYFGKLLIIFIILAALIFFGAKIFLDNKTIEVKTSVVPVPTSSIASPTSIPSPTNSLTKTPTPTPTNVFKFGFKKGPYLPYRITLEPGWTATPETTNSDSRQKATISKGPYSISLTEDLSQATGNCTYPGETPTGTDRPFASFAEINAGTNTFRRGLTTVSSPAQTVCQKQVSGFEFPTQFGYMLYNFPLTDVDANTIIEMDKMLSSIRATQ